MVRVARGLEECPAPVGCDALKVYIFNVEYDGLRVGVGGLRTALS